MAAGVQVIPLRGNSKLPLFDAAGSSWCDIAPDEQWQRAGQGFRGNIGAVLGNGVAVLDADNQQAIESISAFFDGLGINAPQVSTISGGKHYWLRLADAPADFAWCKLAREVGEGELRVSRCYVAAPCSAIGDKRYRFTSGSPESIAATRALRWQDLLELVQPSKPALEFESAPVRLIRRDMPARAELLLSELYNAPQGEPIDKYASRSEAEAAVVAMLILSGWQFSEIAEAFDAAQPGHYSDAGKQARRYLWQTYKSVLSDVCSSPERIELAEHYHQAGSWAWPGRSGALNRAAYLALLAVAWQFSTFEPRASERDLAEHAAATRQGINHAIERLRMLGLVEVMRLGDARRGKQFRLRGGWRIVAISHIINRVGCSEAGKQAQIDTCVAPSPQVAARADNTGNGVALSPVADVLSWADAEVWGAGGLGRSAGVVYSLLSCSPLTISHLAKLSGKARSTVRAALERLARYHLAERFGDGWCRGEADVAQVAEEHRAEQLAIRRRARHERERQAWHEITSEGF